MVSDHVTRGGRGISIFYFWRSTALHIIHTGSLQHKQCYKSNVWPNTHSVRTPNATYRIKSHSGHHIHCNITHKTFHREAPIQVMTLTGYTHSGDDSDRIHTFRWWLWQDTHIQVMTLTGHTHSGDDSDRIHTFRWCLWQDTHIQVMTLTEGSNLSFFQTVGYNLRQETRGPSLFQTERPGPWWVSSGYKWWPHYVGACRARLRTILNATLTIWRPLETLYRLDPG